MVGLVGIVAGNGVGVVPEIVFADFVEVETAGFGTVVDFVMKVGD